MAPSNRDEEGHHHPDKQTRYQLVRKHGNALRRWHSPFVSRYQYTTKTEFRPSPSAALGTDEAIGGIKGTGKPQMRTCSTKCWEWRSANQNDLYAMVGWRRLHRSCSVRVSTPQGRHQWEPPDPGTWSIGAPRCSRA